MPDRPLVHRERRRKDVTLILLWQEYKASTPDDLHYSQFCEAYRKWAKKLDLVMRQRHRAGETLFVDYGDTTFVSLKMAVTGADAWVLAALQQFLTAYIALHGLSLMYTAILGLHAMLWLW